MKEWAYADKKRGVLFTCICSRWEERRRSISNWCLYVCTWSCVSNSQPASLKSLQNSHFIWRMWIFYYWASEIVSSAYFLFVSFRFTATSPSSGFWKLNRAIWLVNNFIWMNIWCSTITSVSNWLFFLLETKCKSYIHFIFIYYKALYQ